VRPNFCCGGAGRREHQWHLQRAGIDAGAGGELLQSKMPAKCGIYYISQGESEFAALDGKVICK
jgi:hypothetical protein